jgi:hypothetical protein
MPSEHYYKKQAKRLLLSLLPFTNSQFRYAAALEAIAHVHGARNWNTLHSRAQNPSTEPVPDEADEQDYLILGKSGAGKTHFAMRLALAHCSKGLPVVVLDYGRSWEALTRGLQATSATLEPGGPVTVQRPSCQGLNPLYYVEVEQGLDASPVLSPEPLRAYLAEVPLTAQTLLVLEEPNALMGGKDRALRPVICEFLKRAQTAGARVIVTAQLPGDVANIPELESLVTYPVSYRQAAR